jgi:anti-sigma factor RsiW
VNCEQATQFISAKLDGELPEAEQVALDAHLAGCAACRATEQALAGQDALLGAGFGERRAAASALAERVIEQLHAAPLSVTSPSHRRTWWANWGRPLLAAAAGFALALLITRPWNQAVVSTVALPASRQTEATTSTKPAPIAQLALATGEVFVCPSGSDQWHALETGGSVAAGMKVRTGSKALCEFKMSDGSQVRMNADTQLTLATPRQVEVTAGQVFSTVSSAQPLVVKSAPANATLSGADTSFDVSCAPGKTTCTVVQGSVKMEAGGNRNSLGSGQSITIAGGNFGEKKQVENLMQATRWVDEILVLKGRDNPELARRIDDIFAQLGHEKMWYVNAQEVRRLGDHCVIPLCRYIESDRSHGTPDDEMKRREAARIVGDVATTWAIPELINLLSDTDGDVRYAAAVALQRLTGQSLGQRPEAWADPDGVKPAIQIKGKQG